MRRIFATWAFYPLTVLFLLCAVTLGNRAVTVISENTIPQRSRCFVIDPGHGGIDGGATSCTGKLESELNLEISLRLRDLMHFLGQNVVMIRTTDISVYTQGDTIAQQKISDLKQRVAICNETEGAVLLSIHQNTFSDSRYSGSQVFYANTDGSEGLAKQLQTGLVSLLSPGSNRQAKKASGIYLMEHINCPGILIECGFLSNPGEEARLRSDEHQKLLCCIIATEAIRYLNADT